MGVLQAMWCALDTSGDNKIDKDEAAAFFKLGQRKPEPMRQAGLKAQKKQLKFAQGHTGTSEALVGSIERHGMDEMASLTRTTREMREDLRLSGDAELSGPELDSVSVKLNCWLEEYRYDRRLPPSHSFFNLFKEIDRDDSGFITFDELTTCVRRELKKGPKAISHTELKALWCALDTSNDNQVDKNEMATFFGRGAAALERAQGGASGMKSRRQHRFRFPTFGRKKSKYQVTPAAALATVATVESTTG